MDFAWTTPKNTKLAITTPKKYDDHLYHPNIGSTPPPQVNGPLYQVLVIWLEWLALQ